MQFNSQKPESKLASIGKLFIAPLFAAFMGFVGSYIGIQKDISTVSSAIIRMSDDIRDLKKKQEDLYTNYYLPSRAEWYEQQNKISIIQAQHEEVRRQISNIHEDLRRTSSSENIRGKKYGGY